MLAILALVLAPGALGFAPPAAGVARARTPSSSLALRPARPSSGGALRSTLDPTQVPSQLRPRAKDNIDTAIENFLDALPIGLRRQLYERLLPLDRGDFKWEFLVPWVPKGTLTALDKFIITTTFVGLSFGIQYVLPDYRGASVGVHAALIVQFFSYAVGNPIFFRLLALVASVLEITGDLLEQRNEGLFTLNLAVDSLITPDWWVPTTEDLFPVVYNIFFLVINLYYVLLWALGNDAFAAPKFTDVEELVYNRCFSPLGLSRALFSRLLRDASFEVGASEGDDDCAILEQPSRASPDGEDEPPCIGTLLCEEGVPLTELFVPLEPVEVRVKGVVTATLPPFRLVGEAALLENLDSDGTAALPSRATVVAPPGARFVRWPHRTFYELQQEEGSDFAASVQLMIARTLSDKLKSARLQAREAAATVNPEIEIQQLRLELAQTRSDLAATSRELDNYKSRALSAFPRREEV